MSGSEEAERISVGLLWASAEYIYISWYPDIPWEHLFKHSQQQDPLGLAEATFPLCGLILDTVAC